MAVGVGAAVGLGLGVAVGVGAAVGLAAGVGVWALVPPGPARKAPRSAKAKSRPKIRLLLLMDGNLLFLYDNGSS